MDLILYYGVVLGSLLAFRALFQFAGAPVGWCDELGTGMGYLLVVAFSILAGQWPWG